MIIMIMIKITVSPFCTLLCQALCQMLSHNTKYTKQIYKVRTCITSILQMSKLRHREAKQLAQGNREQEAELDSTPQANPPQDA